MGEPEEFKQDVKVTFGLIVWVVAVAASMSFLYAQMHFNDRQAEKNTKENRLYTEQEVGGLRADWERENDHIHRRLEKLEEYHAE